MGNNGTWNGSSTGSNRGHTLSTQNCVPTKATHKYLRRLEKCQVTDLRKDTMALCEPWSEELYGEF